MPTTYDVDNIMPSATPTEAEIAAWQELPRDEQVRRMRRILTSPGASTPSDETMSEIWDGIQTRAETHG